MTSFTKRNELTVRIAGATLHGGFAAVLLSTVWDRFWAALTLAMLGREPCLRIQIGHEIR